LFQLIFLNDACCQEKLAEAAELSEVAADAVQPISFFDAALMNVCETQQFFCHLNFDGAAANRALRLDCAFDIVVANVT